MSIHRFNEVTSTNDKARELVATGAASGTVVVASMQTAGRGRSGRPVSKINGDRPATLVFILEAKEGGGDR